MDQRQRPFDSGNYCYAPGPFQYSAGVVAQQGFDVPAGDDPMAAQWDARRMDNALALGLAEIGGFQGLNIYRSQFPAKKLWSRYKEQLVKTGWIAAAVLVLMFVGQLIESYTLNRRIKQIEHPVGQYQAVIKLDLSSSRIGQTATGFAFCHGSPL